MNAFQYILDTSSRKHICPSCSKKRFVRYIDIHTKAYLEHKFGRCDREANCGYHCNPYSEKDYPANKPLYATEAKPQYYIPRSVLYKTLKGYETNTFIVNLLENIAFPFTNEEVTKVIELYYLGTITKGYRKNSITFPFINSDERVCAIQVKQFNSNNNTIATDFLHSILQKYYTKNQQEYPHWLRKYLENEKRVTCLFGEHLLNKYPRNPIALVEAPKSAIYATLYFGLPNDSSNFLWLAVYNLSSLNYAKCKQLQNRNVVLFPDLSENGKAFNLWKKKAGELQMSVQGSKFSVSSLLENYASKEDKTQSKDLADFLIQFDSAKFQKKQILQYPKSVKSIVQNNNNTSVGYADEICSELFSTQNVCTIPLEKINNIFKFDS